MIIIPVDTNTFIINDWLCWYFVWKCVCICVCLKFVFVQHTNSWTNMIIIFKLAHPALSYSKETMHLVKHDRTFDAKMNANANEPLSYWDDGKPFFRSFFFGANMLIRQSIRPCVKWDVGRCACKHTHTQLSECVYSMRMFICFN